jgi:hypothetical protein
MILSPGALALILGAAAIALVATVHGVRGMLARGEWREGASGAFLLGAVMSSGVAMAVSLSKTYQSQQDPYGNTVITWPAWANLLQLGLYVLLALASLYLVLTRLPRRGAVLSIPAVLFLLAALVSNASALLRGDNPLTPYYLVALALLAAATVAPRGLGVHVGLGSFGALAGVFCGVATAVNPSFTAFACNQGKCGVLGVNFRGFLDNENGMALYLALIMPFVYLAFGRRTGALLAGYLLFLTLLTGSRTGAFAAAMTYALLLVVRPDIRRPQFSVSRATVLYGVLGVTAAVGMVLPFLPHDPTDLTGRPALWMLARQTLSEGQTIFLGTGALGWNEVRQAGLIDRSASYSVHNQWLQTLFTGGLLAAALMVAALVVLVAQAGRRYSLVVGCVLLPAVCLAVTERPWAIDYLDWLSWDLLGTLLCYPLTPRETGAAGEGDGARQPDEQRVFTGPAP